MKETYRCAICENIRVPQEMAPCGKNSLFGMEGISTICLDCLINRVNLKNLDSVDRLCQF